ncbi:MAG: peptidase domain-containing ABC transporter [Burkholderiales bacterium]|nr:peptidase domain-containing ABC transporter [Burkholderiales bacterium]
MPLASVHFVWALGAISRLKRIPFAPELVAQQFPPPHSAATLLEAAAALGFAAQRQVSAAIEIQRVPLPCVVLLRPPEKTVVGAMESGAGRGQGDDDNESAHALAIVLKADSEKITMIEPGAASGAALTAADFDKRYAGELILFTPQSKPLTDADAASVRNQSFGFNWFVPELLKHKKIWRDVLLASLAIQLIALATPLFTQVVLDKVVVHQALNTLTVIGIALGVFLVFNAGMSWIRQYLVLHTGTRVDAVLGTQVFDHLLKLPPRYYDYRPTGVVVARLHGVETIREFVSGAAVTLLLDLPFMVIFLAVMFYYSWVLSLITLAILAAIMLLSLAVVPLIRKRVNEQFMLGARNQAFVTEYIAGMETVKSLQMEPQLKARYGEFLSSYLRAGFNTRQLSNTYNAAATTLEQLLTLLILVVGASIVMKNDGFTIGMLVAFQMFAGRMSQPLLRLVGLWQEFQQSAIAVKRLGDIMNAPVEPYSAVPARDGAGLGAIEICDLSFRYGDNLPYLYRHLNAGLRPGTCVALMGPSGSGKSTLAKLLQSFYLPTEGQIKIDGHDIRHLAANELRNYFGVVPQETVLFSGSIYDNLIIANPSATFDQMMQACRWAEIHDTIEQLPEGYQTQIGEHGAGLSGGQKQRLAIARALLKRPKILIFDEAASNLDRPTAEQFARTINQLKGKVTMLYITHQLPKGLEVDEIVNLESREN